MYKLNAALALAAVVTMGAFAQTPAPSATNQPRIKVEGAETSSTFGAFEASVLAQLDRQVAAQIDTLIALRDKYREDSPDVEAAKLNLAVLQAQRDALARTNADIANRRMAALLDPGMPTRGRGAAVSVDRSAQPAAHETLFNFSKSQSITGTIARLTLASPYSVVTVDVAGARTDVFLASANALAAGGWSRGTVKIGDEITVTGAPARGGSDILQATEASSNGKTLFSRPAVELSREAVAAYEK